MDNLLEILNELRNHHREKSSIMEQCVNERLKKSLVTYYKEVTQSMEFLSKKDELRIMKKMNRG